MAELHFFPMYASDWLAGEATTLMTPEQEGAFLRLLLHSWLSTGVPCSIPCDDASLAEMSKLRKRWKAVGGFVREQFETVDEYPDRIRNPKLWTVYVEQMEKHSKRVIAGALGGVAKAKRKQKPSNAKAMLQQKPSTPATAMLYQSESESESELDTETTKTTTSDSGESARVGWPVEASRLWSAGVAPIPIPRIGGQLKTTVAVHGWPKVKAGMEAYIVGGRDGNLNLQNFANNANYWIKMGWGAPRTAAGELSMNHPNGDETELGRLVRTNARKSA